MKTFSITDIGIHRKMNQDYFYTSEMPVGNLPNLFIVADGMGGHNAGEYASKHTVETMVKFAKASHLTQPASILEEAIKAANEEILKKAEEDISMKGMGTTVVAASVLDHKLYVANVGDSRLYLVNREIRQITRDHSYVEEMVRRGELDKETAREHPDKNIITRAVGATKEIEIDFFETELKHEDEILLCSDGLTNMVEDSEIRTIIKGQRDTAEKAERLILAANANGGKDNITVVVIDPFSDEVNG
ncbi:Stp1/IreP family PP2C-type Ser/Thr phosphatase [Roseburia sp. BX1005]|uniref:Stp1/IreP family PP2C-type Ser/Thr phosphatase n=1 Tax=Roseburia zhanii TaxID=2763064 RepID=A0A923LNI6_9FIRM|nr:Stp1/IreP family PP2C-type Ser/Thr phosphatase [Roseburia zhanii]OLA91471.1 MAG: serine/threonine protein phosphatase [Roseburia sp. 40_7]